MLNTLFSLQALYSLTVMINCETLFKLLAQGYWAIEYLEQIIVKYFKKSLLNCYLNVFLSFFIIYY